MNDSPKEPSVSLTQFIRDGTGIQDNSAVNRRGRGIIDGSNCGGMTAEGWLNELDDVKSVYIHVPFCFHKCHYCDFYSIAGAEVQFEPFVKQLAKELQQVGKQLNSVETIFIGGGTPTIFDIDLFDEMLQSVATYIPRSVECEWTIEANPETVTIEKANAMVRNGVNRVSIGAQSFNADLLKALERWHDISTVQRSVDYIRQAGIEDMNLDLIYAIPSQTKQQLLFDIEQAMYLQPAHMSCYSLIYEPNTPLRTRLDRGDVQRVDHELEASMFEIVREELAENGYGQYEISNFAKQGRECQHNLAYWNNKSWWPIGPSASGHLGGLRWKNAPRITDYLNGGPMPQVIDVESLDADASAGESFMVGLRMLKGMERPWVESLIQQSANRWRAEVILQFIEEGLLNWNDDYLALTDKGLRFADTVILALLMQDETITDSKEQ